MQLKNITKSTIVTNDLKIAKSFYDKTIGLLSKKNPRSLLFYTRFGIHTIGLKLPIDILILDSNGKVVKLKKNCPTNNFFFWNPKYNQVIELPSNTIKKTKTQIGDQLKITKN